MHSARYWKATYELFVPICQHKAVATETSEDTYVMLL
jgi:hypothetical protein